MRALPKIGERSGLGDLIQAEHGGSSKGVFGVRGQRVLNALSFERANDAETHSAANGAAELAEEEQADGGMAIDPEPCEDRPINWGEVAERCFCKRTKGALDCGQEGLALQTAGTIRNVIGGERIESRIELGQALRLQM